MENLVWLIPVLACPLMMVAMMLMMGKGMGTTGREKHEEDQKQDGAPRPVAELQAERDRLDAEIERREGAGRGAENGQLAAHTTPGRHSPV